ncbi:hypothetical protein IMSAG249_00906 [Lachnospiraceae bacterium]|jgi:predicted small lipoprotein YifL|nr:hypothetical protein [Lachnospiraceae bacterium]GFI15612.1 hypothetical protein IMSAGC009_00771 [Lachnospiraceae bacterium]GFI69085.1 hypothetical protein IMSAG249_00906 [Lachnospiraceae bacterium]
MKKLKKLLAVVATMAVVCMTLTGCGEKLPPADQTISSLFELAAKNNAAPMKDLLGFASEEEVRSAFFEEGADVELVDELKSELESAGVELSEEDVQDLTDSLETMLNKITYTAEITSQEKDTTVVTLKVNGFSYEEMTNIIMDAANTMMESITEEDQIAIQNGDMEVFNNYMQQYVKDFVAGLAALEPTADPVEFTVNCEKLSVEVNGKDKVAWLPSDMDGFSVDVENAMFQ